jgi:hypothetical protein
VKDKNIIISKTKKYLPFKQCYGKKPYDFKRRALKYAREYAIETGLAFTVYECPHCGKFHIGKVREN